MRSIEEIMAQLAVAVKGFGRIPRSEMSDEERNAARTAYKVAGFFVTMSSDRNTWLVGCTEEVRKNLGNLNPELTQYWSTGEEGKEDKV